MSAHLTIAMAALAGPMLIGCRGAGRTAALEAVGRELAAAEYLHRSASDGDAVALRYLPDGRRRLCAALLRTQTLGVDGEAIVPLPAASPVRLRDAYDAVRRLRTSPKRQPPGRESRISTR